MFKATYLKHQGTLLIEAASKPIEKPEQEHGAWDPPAAPAGPGNVIQAPLGTFHKAGPLRTKPRIHTRMRDQDELENPNETLKQECLPQWDEGKAKGRKRPRGAKLCCAGGSSGPLLRATQPGAGPGAQAALPLT